MKYFLFFVAVCIFTSAAIGQTCDVDFPGSSSLNFSTECGGSSVDDLTIGKDTFIGDNDVFTFDSPATIDIDGNFNVNAEGDGRIVIPAGVTVNVSGNFQLDAQNSGCESGSPCTFEFVVEGTLNVNSNLQNNLVTLIWSGTGTVDVDDSFEISSNGCMECGVSSCPAFPAGSGGCSDDGDGCTIDFCVDGNYGNTSPLPIVLIYFKGRLHNTDVLLEWATASEINNDFFTIERSSTDLEFEEILTLPGAGNSSQVLNYSILDNDPLWGRSYYRLKQTDFDGAFAYSEIISIDKTLDLSRVEVFPNPASGQVHLQFGISEGPPQSVNMYLTNVLGQQVLRSKIDIHKGFNEITVKLPDLKSGIYYISIPVLTRKTSKLVVL